MDNVSCLETGREADSEKYVIKMKLTEKDGSCVVINLYFNFQIVINLGEMSTRRNHYKVLQTQLGGT